MARSKARVYTCFALTTLFVVAAVVCIAVLARREKCPTGAFLKAAAAADSRKCSEVARDILQRGGSAVDGAIAALLCTSVMNPQSMGIGGGSIFTVMDRSGKVKIINSRETVPRKFNSNLLKSCSNTLSNSGSQWIGVPGEIRGYEQAHRLYGKLPWATLFQPTIQMARRGFPLPPVQGRYVSYINANDTQSLRELYSDENGRLLKTGDTVKFEKLADTLETIAEHGANAFYTGPIAENLVRDIQEAGGTLTVQDLAAYTVTVSDAWAVPVGEYQMYIPPPPAGGIILSLILNILKGYDMNSASLRGEQKTLTYHRYAEAFKFANGLKKNIRDPEFGSEEAARRLLEERFAEHIRSLISSDETHELQYYNVTPHLDGMGTTHVSVLAEDGSAVSVTSTINHIFGSKVFSASTGVILNNELSDFCGRADNIFPGEQPPSSMAPVVLKSPSRTLVVGASGGSMITTGISSMLINHLWFGKSLKEAIAAPVVFVDAQNALKFEPAFDKSVIEGLEALGHKRENATFFYNVVNVVEKDGDCICAASDARKLGEAAGY
ncbi:gamma-glutamyltransferase 5a isoform X1 [Betta splendens]|uniref:Glutathione hydrolase n=1 Tax=Betta splendens TaxID=158456 RepID=A0A6P7NIN6_BETSP|nr:gamma-glutamyltransferase 5a isoform X1 [Betta splendens]